MDNRPKMCWNCKKLIGLETTCPYCGASYQKPVARAQSFSRKWGGASRFTTAQLLIRFCVLMFILTLLLGTYALGVSNGLLGGLFNPDSRVLGMMGTNVFFADKSRWWTVVTGVFLHAGILHIGFNMYGLHVMGQLLETMMGKKSFWIIFFLSAVGGGLVTAHMGNASVGASNGIFGVMAAATVIAFFLGDGIHDPIFRSLMFWGGVSLALGFAPGSRFDNWGHIGGLFTGVFLGYFWVKAHRLRVYPAIEMTLSVLCLLAMLVCYGYLALQLGTILF